MFDILTLVLSKLGSTSPFLLLYILVWGKKYCVTTLYLVRYLFINYILMVYVINTNK